MFESHREVERKNHHDVGRGEFRAAEPGVLVEPVFPILHDLFAIDEARAFLGRLALPGAAGGDGARGERAFGAV